MAKKWHTRGSSAISSALAVVILAGAGVAMASQGSMAEMVSGAREALFGPSQPVAEPRAADDGGSPHDRGSGAGEETGDPAICDDMVAKLRAQMPARGNEAGIERAISVVAANCMKNPAAPGLMNALQHLLDRQGGPGNGNGQGNGHAYGQGPGNPGNHAGQPNHPGNQDHEPQNGNDPPGNPGNGHSSDPGIELPDTDDTVGSVDGVIDDTVGGGSDTNGNGGGNGNGQGHGA